MQRLLVKFLAPLDEKRNSIVFLERKSEEKTTLQLQG